MIDFPSKSHSTVVSGEQLSLVSSLATLPSGTERFCKGTMKIVSSAFVVSFAFGFGFGLGAGGGAFFPIISGGGGASSVKSKLEVLYFKKACLWFGVKLKEHSLLDN